MPIRTVPVDGPLDLRRTVGIHQRGSGDLTMRVVAGRIVRATRTVDGPATVALRPVAGGVEAEAWGPGADRALDAVPALIGLGDDRSGFEARHHPLVAELDRHQRGIRLGRTGAVLEALVPAILEQKVTGTEAWRGLRGLIHGWGEPAPGPFGLRLLPEASVLAGLPYHAFHPLGVERRRADLVRRVDASGIRFDGILSLALHITYDRLTDRPLNGSC